MVLAAAVTRAGMFDEPSDALLFNSFSSVRVVDSVAVATCPTGVVVLKLDPVTGYFHEAGFESLPSEPVTSKQCGDFLLVRSFSNIVYVLDISTLPEVVLLHRINLGVDFYDMAYRADRLFVAAGFSGLKQYLLSESADPILVDSSLTGVHCVQVDVFGDQILLLDDYNGILRYDVSDGFLGQVDERLLLPRQALSFCRSGDELAIPLVGQGLVYWAEAQAGAMSLTDSLKTTIIAGECYLADTLLVLANASSRIMEVRSTLSSAKTLVSLPIDTPSELEGAVYFKDGSQLLVYPNSEGGLSQYNLTDIWFNNQPGQAYNHPGPVTALSSHESMLLTGGVNNPFEVYSLDTDSRALLECNYAGLDHVGPICDAGDFVFAYFTGLRYLYEFDVSADSITSLAGFIPQRIPDRIRYYDYPAVDSIGLLLLAGSKVIDLYGVKSNGKIIRGATPTAETLGTILDFTVVDSFLVVTTADRQLYWFRLWGGINAMLWGSISTTGALDHITTTGLRPSFGDWTLPDMVLAFEGNKMYQVSVLYSGPAFVNYLTTLPVSVVNSARLGTDLFTIGPMGVGRIDLRYSVPQLIDYGGYAGNLVACADSTVAVSDGSSLFLYRVIPAVPTGVMETPVDASLPHDFGLVNYPNPFNPATRISFNLPGATEVELTIMNIVGQRVVTLVEGRLEAGAHTVTWDGSDSRGHQVASGVYLYRLCTSEGTASKKMILLR